MRCPDPLPPLLETRIQELAQAWALDPARLRVSEATNRAWETLLEDWITDSNLPLIMRRPSAGRGCIVRHLTGRELVPADNSPAHWALGLALQGQTPTLEQVKGLLAQDLI